MALYYTLLTVASGAPRARPDPAHVSARVARALGEGRGCRVWVWVGALVSGFHGYSIAVLKQKTRIKNEAKHITNILSCMVLEICDTYRKYQVHVLI